MYEFTYTTQASRVVFGAGSMNLIQQEVATLGARRALILCTPEQKAQAEVVSSLLGPSSAGVFDGAQMHVPIENARRARSRWGHASAHHRRRLRSKGRGETRPLQPGPSALGYKESTHGGRPTSRPPAESDSCSLRQTQLSTPAWYT